MKLTRRGALLSLLAPRAFGQGMASRGVRPTPRGKPSGRPFPVRFTDIAAQAGLRDPLIYGRADGKDYIIETIGGGVAFFDFDNDGWLDIFIAGGSRLTGEPPAASNRLYRNNRDGTFTDVTAKAGLLRSGWANGVAVGDFNNDGYDDLFVSYWGQNALYRNNGNGTFTDIAAEAGLHQPQRMWNSGCTFVDYDRDGHLDLFVAGYLDFDPARIPKPGASPNCVWKGVPVNCGPRGLPRGRCFLYHNDGKGHFRDVSETAGIAKARAYGLTAVAADFDEDGWPDLYVACDSTYSLFYRNNHDGTFSEEGLERGTAVNDDGQEQAGMGVGIGDFEPDGHLDILKTHFADDTVILYKNNGKGIFSDVTIRAGLSVETRFVCWAAGMVDFDNDGLPDLFIATGSVYPEIEAVVPSHAYKTPRVIFRNLGEGKFEELIEEAGPGIAARHSSRGAAFGDFDNDGDMDIAVMNMDEPPSLLRNDCTSNHRWIKIRLEGTKSNRSAIGARVLVRYGGKSQVQEVLSQSSFFSSNDRRLHFGVGPADQVDVEVRWPTGTKQSFPALSTNHLHWIREGDSATKPMALPGKTK